MEKRFSALALYRLSVSALAFGMVAAQVINGMLRPPFDMGNYFSFFSIQSSLLAACVLAASGISVVRAGRGESLTFWRGAATLYLTLAGTVYLVLLRGYAETLQTPREQTNAVLHYLVPAALLADWFFSPKERVPLAKALLWLLYPLLYVLYSLARGHFCRWYPYPFLTPSASGYAGIVTVCLAMAAAMIAFIFLMTRSTAHKPGRL